MMVISKYHLLISSVLISLHVRYLSAFDDPTTHDLVIEDNGPIPKDKVLLKDVKTLVFHRHRMTTSRRTHPIHQLSCVGGTAGCKLFTPNVVECQNIGYDKDKSKFNWKCKAEISDRITFNHVEVICEGYDYPEDDHILLGSCGLEFTLDYTDPHDYHHNSYFKHMDSHEKEMHLERVRSTAKNESPRLTGALYDQLVNNVSNHLLLYLSLVALVFLSLVVVRLFASKSGTNLPTGGKKLGQRGSAYGPLTSAVLTTKKAC